MKKASLFSKIASLIFAVFLSFGLAACGNKSPSAAPVITPVSTVFDAYENRNVVLNVDYKSQNFVSLKQGDTELARSNYMLTATALTIRASYLATLDHGEYGFVFTSEGGSTEFSVTVREAEYTGVYKVQESQNADIIFDLGTDGATVLSVKADGVKLAEEDYETGADTLTLKGGYLGTQPIGIKTIAAVTEQKSIVCYAGVYGASDSAHLFGLSGMLPALMNNFEGALGNTGRGLPGLSEINMDVTKCEYGVTEADDPLSISGKSYSIKSDAELVVFIYGVGPGPAGTDTGFKANTLYNIKMKLRADTVTSDKLKLIMTWDATRGTSASLQDYFVINDLQSANSAIDKKDLRSTGAFVSDHAGGYWDLNVYAYSDVANGSLTFALISERAITSAFYTTIIDDLQICETTLPL